MEKFEVKIENNEAYKPFLNDWDKKYLELGMVGMLGEMYKDFGLDFPDVIILPEKGARPLYYLLDPVFKKLNKKENTTIPKFIFFNVCRMQSVAFMTAEECSDINIKTNTDFKKALKATRPYLSSKDIKEILAREELEKLMVVRQKRVERAEEIDKITKNKRLAIVDEVSATGTTTREITRAFGHFVSEYTIVGLSSGSGDGKVGYRFDDESDSYNPETDSYRFSFENAHNAIGVTKLFDKKYTTPIRENDSLEQEKLIREKEQLRKEMRVFGEQIAENISLEDNKKVAPGAYEQWLRDGSILK
ncbi:MAG: hypothetical protein Q7S47_02025 [bacterium]|nr:hypothetical protein [bacterium]